MYLEGVHRIIHFDLKPSNILISAEMVSKIADFGSNRIKTDNSVSFRAPRGTWQYVAPEGKLVGINPIYPHARAQDTRVHKSCDVYSLGIMLLEVLVRRKPGTYTKGEPEVHSVQIHDGIRVHTARCICPEPVRELIQDCIRFDPNQVGQVPSSDFVRPSYKIIERRIKSMLKQPWIDDTSRSWDSGF